MQGPEFICIGAHKAATTWLAGVLEQHPDVFIPFTKELHYFDALELNSHDFWVQHFQQILKSSLHEARTDNYDPNYIAHLEKMSDPAFMLSPEWYAAAFENKPHGALGGEFTPRYSTLSRKTVQNIRQSLPQTRIIYIIREPVARALSDFRMHLAQAEINTDCLEDIEQAARDWVANRQFFRGNYAEFIPRWDAQYLEGDDILYLPFGKVKTNPAELIAVVEKFLGLKPYESYRGLRMPVHPTRKIFLPAWLGEELEQKLRVHSIFLENRFPAAFTANIS